MDKILKLNREIERLGGRPVFAAALSTPTQTVSPQMLWNWLNRDRRVPAQYCPAVERLTDRAIVCEDFWPDTDWEYIRANPALLKPKRRSAPSP